MLEEAPGIYKAAAWLRYFRLHSPCCLRRCSPMLSLVHCTRQGIYLFMDKRTCDIICSRLLSSISALTPVARLVEGLQYM